MLLYLLFVLAASASINSARLAQGAGVKHAPAATKKYSLLGFSLGESASDLRKMLGAPQMMLDSNHGIYSVYQSKKYNLWVAFLVHLDRVESIVLLPLRDQQSSYRDAFGLTFGDDLREVERMRPDPIAVPPDMLTYQMANAEEFVYGMRGDQIYAVELTAGATNIPPMLINFEYNGLSPQQAIELRQPLPIAIETEQQFAIRFRCGRGHWRWISSTPMKFDGESYHMALFGCDSMHLRRPLYFLLGSRRNSFF